MSSTDEAYRRQALRAELPGTESETALHRVLASQRRCVVLDVFGDREPPIGLDELAAAVADREREIDGERRDQDQVQVTLYHHHLPKMADLGLVEFDPESMRVESYSERW